MLHFKIFDICTYTVYTLEFNFVRQNNFGAWCDF